MPNLSRILKTFPLSFFFILTFLISWGMWFVSLPIYQFSSHMAALVGTLGLFGPFISAIVITTVIKKNVSIIHLSEIWKTLSPVFFVLILAGFLGYTHTDLFNADFFVGVLVIGVALYFLYRMFKRPNDLNFGFVKMQSPKKKWIWSSVALLLPPLIVAGGIYFQFITGSEITGFPYFRNIISVEGIWRVLLVFSAVLLYLGPLGEEPGWRGFALPILLKLQSPLNASIIIAVIWGIWHLPVDLAGREISMLMEALLRRLSITLPGSVIFTWLYIRSGQCMVSCLVLHASFSTTWIYILPSDFSAITLYPFALIFIFTSKMWKKIT